MTRPLAILATALILAMPVVAQVERSRYTVRWEAATGPVAHYQLRIRGYNNDGPMRWYYVTHDAAPQVDLSYLPPEPYWMDVRACKVAGCGEWSDPWPYTMDLDEDGVVGVGDFGLMSKHWSDGTYGVGDYAEMLRHWGGETVLNNLGVRVYR